MNNMLIYLIGASGSGKDSILSATREQLATDDTVFFAHRYITRPVPSQMQAGSENHIALTEAEFHKYRDAGFFCMHWQGNGLHYGIGIEVAHWLKSGKTVVVNGSRAYLETASDIFAEKFLPVQIEVSLDVLKDRLTARGRENAEQINKRLDRAKAYNELSHPKLLKINNDTELANAVGAFIGILKGANRHENQA